MDDLEKFANLKGTTTSSTVLKDTALASKIIGYKEPALILRQFCFDYPMAKLSGILPKDPGSTNMAVEVAEGSEIPRFRTRMTTQSISLHKNATAMFMTDEAEIEDFSGAIYTHEMKEKGLEMARKTDHDIANVLLAGAGDSSPAVTTGLLTTYDVSLAKAELILKDRQATDIIMNPTQWADVESEAVVLAVNDLNAGVGYQGNEKIAGLQVTTLSGLRVTLSNKCTAGTVIVLDRTVDPVWFAFYGTTKTTTFTEPGVGRGAIVTAYENPVMMDSSAVFAITSC